MLVLGKDRADRRHARSGTLARPARHAADRRPRAHRAGVSGAVREGGLQALPRAADRASGRVEVIEVVAADARRPEALFLSMNAVEYCLLNGLKVAGPDHPALLSAGEMLSYGALRGARRPVRGGLREAGVRAERPRLHADARHAGHHRDASRRDGGGCNCGYDVEPGFAGRAPRRSLRSCAPGGAGDRRRVRRDRQGRHRCVIARKPS